MFPSLVSFSSLESCRSIAYYDARRNLLDIYVYIEVVYENKKHMMQLTHSDTPTIDHLFIGEFVTRPPT